jgi:hypothetical protein
MMMGIIDDHVVLSSIPKVQMVGIADPPHVTRQYILFTTSFIILHHDK